MQKQSPRGRGRPRSDKEKAVTCRHVVNFTPEDDDAVQRYADQNGFMRKTDAIRRLVGIALRKEGVLS